MHFIYADDKCICVVVGIGWKSYKLRHKRKFCAKFLRHPTIRCIWIYWYWRMLHAIRRIKYQSESQDSCDVSLISTGSHSSHPSLLASHSLKVWHTCTGAFFCLLYLMLIIYIHMHKCNNFQQILHEQKEKSLLPF